MHAYVLNHSLIVPFGHGDVEMIPRAEIFDEWMSNLVPRFPQFSRH